MIEIYEVDGGTDGFDFHTIGYFTNKAAAVQVSRGRGSMGVSDGTIRTHQVYESLQEYRTTAHPDAIKARALAKLTPEERKSLGF